MARRFPHIRAANQALTGATIAIAAHVMMLTEAPETTVIVPIAMMTPIIGTAMNGSAATNGGSVSSSE